MKNLRTITFGFLCLFSIISFTQNQIVNDSRFIKSPLFIKNSGKNITQPLSSSLVIKYALDYEVRKFWDEATNQLVNDAKTEYAFDDKGFPIQEIHSHWEDSQWNVGWKVEYSNDTNGNLIQQINSYYWGNQWEPELKQEYTYDTNENLIQHIEYLWRPTTNQWDNMWKSEFTYDTMDNLIQEIYYEWSSNQWVNEEKSEYIYDTNQNKVLEIEYTWSANQWINDFKIEYTYDTNDNLTQVIEYRWNSSQWNPLNKYEYAYDAQLNLTQNIYYYWNVSLNQWIYKLKNEFTYDIYENIIQSIRYRWNVIQWLNEYKTDYTYNNSYSFSDLILPYFYAHPDVNIFFNHMMTNNISYDWNSTLNVWEVKRSFNFSYSEQEILSIPKIEIKQLKVYPNPVTNILTIKSVIIPIDKVEIFSLSGKMIKEIKLDYDKINTSELSKGVYLLRIYSKNNIFIKKIIKN